MESPYSFPANGKKKTGVLGGFCDDSLQINCSQFSAYWSLLLVQRALLELVGFLVVLVEGMWRRCHSQWSQFRDVKPSLHKQRLMCETLCLLFNNF